MAQKHLKELLKEDQEPFQLKDYIADKKCQFKKEPQRSQIQLKKPKPMSRNSSFFCKNACFLSLQDSPDLRKSPLFDFPSSVKKSPCKSPNRVFLNVPAKTAAVLLEAAMRIQKQTKPKTQIKNSGFGLFGSMLKRLTLRNRTHKLKDNETGEKKTGENRGDLILVNMNENVATLVSSSTISTTTSSSSSSWSSCSYSCNGRQSSLDLESSSSGRSFDGDDDDEDDGFEFANVLKEINGDYGLCLSPLSPFRFALQTSPSPDRRSPVFSSPAKSPARHKFEDNVHYEQESSGKFLMEEDEEDKEQNSPVSVLDPPFEDDYDGEEEDSYDIEGSYAFVQRAKHHLLHKLHRFEKLAELDPIELEKRLIEDDEDVDTELSAEQSKDYKEYDYESFTFDEQTQVDEFIDDIIRTSGLQDIKKSGIKRLVSDLILEEESVENSLDSDNQLIKRVCKKLESWREVEANTIDMMVEMDLRMREIGDWKKPQEQIGENASDIEAAIFSVLVEELVEDLTYSAWSC